MRLSVPNFANIRTQTAMSGFLDALQTFQSSFAYAIYTPPLLALNARIGFVAWRRSASKGGEFWRLVALSCFSVGSHRCEFWTLRA